MSRPAVGYAAMLEQFHPTEVVDYCAYAEQAGFSGVMAADHYQPWVPAQGQAAFVWNVLAAVGERTTGEYWPEAPERLARMWEAIEVIQKLFTGKDVKHAGHYFKLETSRLWTMPDPAPPVIVATAGPITAKRTGKQTDGIITPGATPQKVSSIFAKFDEGAREAGKDPSAMPKILQLHLSWAETDEAALHNAMTEWPNGGMKFPKQDIRTPQDFEQIAKLVRPEDFSGRLLISADPDLHRAEIQRFLDLGVTHLYLHNVGRNQREWIDVFGREVLPQLVA